MPQASDSSSIPQSDYPELTLPEPPSARSATAANHMWTMEDDAVLRLRYSKEGCSKQLCVDLSRTKSAVGGRACKLGLYVDRDNVRNYNFKDLKGHIFSDLTVLEYAGTRDASPRWHCRCVCGRNAIVRSSYLANGDVKSCGCRRGEACLIEKGISSFYYRIVKKNAKTRGIIFDISLDYLGDLFLSKDGKCALSGAKLTFKINSHKGVQTASLDRIDSTKGYIEGNVQWVHKDVNLMKMDLDNADFISYCCQIADNHRSTHAS